MLLNLLLYFGHTHTYAYNKHRQTDFTKTITTALYVKYYLVISFRKNLPIIKKSF